MSKDFRVAEEIDSVASIKTVGNVDLGEAPPPQSGRFRANL